MLARKDYLVKVAKTDPRTYCWLLGKILPTQVTGNAADEGDHLPRGYAREGSKRGHRQPFVTSIHGCDRCSMITISLQAHLRATFSSRQWLCQRTKLEEIVGASRGWYGIPHDALICVKVTLRTKEQWGHWLGVKAVKERTGRIRWRSHRGESYL